MEKLDLNENISAGQNIKYKLIPGTFSKCYYCDVDNMYCKKYEKTKWDLGDNIWDNYCLKDGGCDK